MAVVATMQYKIRSNSCCKNSLASFSDTNIETSRLSAKLSFSKPENSFSKTVSGKVPDVQACISELAYTLFIYDELGRHAYILYKDLISANLPHLAGLSHFFHTLICK
jgi:hypothetical protein